MIKASKILTILKWYFVGMFFGVQASAAPPIHPRQVDLSGNIFQFSMPENFSKDVPAANMVEKLDVEDLKKFDNPEYGNIIRRWWDIKRPGFFGKALGIVMMDISVQKIAENKKKALHVNTYTMEDRLDFLLMLNDKLHQRYDELNKSYQEQGDDWDSYSVSFCHLIGEQLRTFYRDYIYNGQKWIGYTVIAPNSQLIVGFVTPLTQSTYVELVFTYSPNHNVIPNEFLAEAKRTTQLIEDSLFIKFSSEHAIKRAIEGEWLRHTNSEVLQLNKDRLLIPFFGENIYERIKEGMEAARRLTQEMNLPIDDNQIGSGF